MPRYVVHGVEAPINPITATSPADIALTVLTDQKKQELRDAQNAAGSNTKFYVVGAAVVGLVALVLGGKKLRKRKAA